MPKYEIKVSNDIPSWNNGWSVVGFEVFRSWAGERRVDGVDFVGPVYYYLTDVVVKPKRTPMGKNHE
jgi:hypothetical protein